MWVQHRPVSRAESSRVLCFGLMQRNTLKLQPKLGPWDDARQRDQRSMARRTADRLAAREGDGGTGVRMVRQRRDTPPYAPYAVVKLSAW